MTYQFPYTILKISAGLRWSLSGFPAHWHYRLQRLSIRICHLCHCRVMWSRRINRLTSIWACLCKKFINVGTSSFHNRNLIYILPTVGWSHGRSVSFERKTLWLHRRFCTVIVVVMVVVVIQSFWYHLEVLSLRNLDMLLSLIYCGQFRQ